MSVVLAAVAVAALVLVTWPSSRPRLGRVPRERRPARRSLLLPLGVVAGVGCLAVGGPTAAVVAAGGAAALLVRRVVRRSAAGSDDVALCVDLIAGCLCAGATPVTALRAAAAAAPAGVAIALREASADLARGDPSAWSRLEAGAPALAEVARACARAGRTGSAIADELHRLAARQRARRDTARRQRLHRTSVWLVLPLGLCFLPAFVLLGIVPFVVAAVPGAVR